MDLCAVYLAELAMWHHDRLDLMEQVASDAMTLAANHYQESRRAVEAYDRLIEAGRRSGADHPGPQQRPIHAIQKAKDLSDRAQVGRL